MVRATIIETLYKGELMVLLPRTPPYDWAWMVGFLQARAVAGVERFHDGATAAALAWKATAG